MQGRPVLFAHFVQLINTCKSFIGKDERTCLQSPPSISEIILDCSSRIVDDESASEEAMRGIDGQIVHIFRKILSDLLH